jgi:phage terminase small subunit
VVQAIDSPTSMYMAAHPDVRLGPLMELLQDQATKHYYHTNDLGDQIASLHSEIHGMFEELKVIVGKQPTVEVDKFVETVEKSMSGLEHRLRKTESSDGAIMSLKGKLDNIHAEIRRDLPLT